MNHSKTSLKKAWDALKKEFPKLRIKDAADRLGVSEAELVTTQQDVTRLNEDWPGLFSEAEQLGYVMALTRNESVVHERKGEYHNISFSKHVGLVLDTNIDLRIFPGKFGFAFAVPVQTPRGTLHSIQFFDKYGIAIHKIYLMNGEKLSAYNQLVSKFKHTDQDSILEIETAEKTRDYEVTNNANKDTFLSRWAKLKDTHDFYPLLKKFKIDRTHALKMAEGRFSYKVDNSATELMLLKASENEIPIMVFVSSGGVIQIHSGKVNKIKKMDNWLNVLDPEFNLHLREDHIAQSWIVEKPTKDGIVTSLEIFDKNNNSIATFFGVRKPGIPELDGWKQITQELRAEGVEA